MSRVSPPLAAVTRHPCVPPAGRIRPATCSTAEILRFRRDFYGTSWRTQLMNPGFFFFFPCLWSKIFLWSGQQFAAHERNPSILKKFLPKFHGALNWWTEDFSSSCSWYFKYCIVLLTVVLYCYFRAVVLFYCWLEGRRSGWDSPSES